MTGPGPSSSPRCAGLLVPLFSCHSARSWGIGEFGDVPRLASWMRDAGLRVLQFLPLNELAPGQTSPYSALSAMALDPIFISVPDVPDFEALGGEAALDTAQRGMLEHVRAKPGVDYWAVRTLKERTLRRCFARFLETEWADRTPRADDLRDFVREQAWWLDDYAAFRAVVHVSDGQYWREWPADARDRSPLAMARIAREHRQEILYRQYLQWLAHAQWQAARREAADVRMFGDFPFMVAADSADAWSHQGLFSFEGTVGAPPDEFSRDGQNWKLPVYRWDVLRERRYDWFQQRAKRMADLFDAFRVDHVVGLFRMWVFPNDAVPPHFVPADEPTQIAQGRAVLSVIRQAGAEVIAEDLGTIPDFVRAALTDLGIPGYRVLRWERHWHVPDQPFVDPVGYPALSLATSGTHDTDTLVAWWNGSGPDERERILEIAVSRHEAVEGLSVDAPFVPVVRDLLLELLYASGSDLLVVPVQDVFGWADRVNVPAVVDTTNWTWKLPWLLDEFVTRGEAAERQQTLRRWAASHGRARTAAAL